MVVETAVSAVTYRGEITRPERWKTWVPRDGDILVCTPPKSGTTWTQAILAMLVNGGPDLPDTLGAMSPWVDADLGVRAEDVARTIAALPGRRVLKTHTPADGFPVWDGVSVVAVYRHPLDVFFSLRRHIANRQAGDDHPMKAPVAEALSTFLNAPIDRDDFDSDSLSSIAHHYLQTVLSGRIPGLTLLHYADITRDPRAAIRKLARAVDIDAADALVEAIAQATDIAEMRARADRYAPVGGTGFWRSDAAFFATGGTGTWTSTLTEADLAAYDARMAELIPEAAARRWLEEGSGSAR